MVDTGMANLFENKSLVATPEQCANQIIKALGNCSITPGAYKHWLTNIFAKLFNPIFQKPTKTTLD